MLLMMVIDKYWCYIFIFQGHHCLYLLFSAGVNNYFFFYVALILEAHLNKFTVGMLETPLRVGVPFQVS